mgnify:CR=1 FL=1
MLFYWFFIIFATKVSDVKKMKIDNLCKSLQLYYYLAFLLFFAVAFLSSCFIKEPLYELGSNVAILLQSVGIMYVIISVPLGLWIFSQKLKTLKTKDSVQCFYKKIWLLRLSLISFGVILNVLLFYILKDLSMLYAAAIAAIAFIFCKPTMIKIENDFSIFDEQNEQGKEE